MTTSEPSPRLWSDVRRVGKLAVPVAIAEVGWMAMTTVDTIMVASLGPAAIGAIGLGGSAFYSFAVFGMGLLLGLDTLVAQAFGAGRREDCHRSLTQGVYLALFLTAPLMLLFWWIPDTLGPLRVTPEVAVLTGKFVRSLSFSTLPLLLYGAFRRYLQAMGHVRPVMFVLVSANVANWMFNWLLIEGHWGFPALGVAGSALSTCLARVYMAGALAFFVWWFERKTALGLRGIIALPDRCRLVQLVRIGFPAASQILLEIGAFGAAALLAGRLTPIALAAHQISLNCAAMTFMVPLGISSAAAVAVGQAVGRGDFDAARRSGFVALGLGCAFMSCSAVAFLLVPETILRIYTSDPAVLRIGVGLLALAALFQLFDGTQTIATGALRGLGSTREAMFTNLAGYWAFGLPIGYVLCFRYGLGVRGLWWGLTLALIAIALVLLYSWDWRSRRIAPLSTGAGELDSERRFASP